MANAANSMMQDTAVCHSHRNVRPPVNNFSPSMWGHTFSAFIFDDQVQERYADAIEVHKEEVKVMLMAAKSEKLIILIDRVERLGLAYHFEREIEEKIEEIYNLDVKNYPDLFNVALGFRLLRQHQYHVCSSVFEKFTDEDKKFKEGHGDDVEGLLSLYEAAHVQIHGEDILEEGLAFAVHHLTRMLPQLEYSLQHKLKDALQQPLHKGIPIVNAHKYISIFQDHVRDSKDELLLKLAKLNFNFLQNLYKKELSQLSRWWNKFDLQSKLPFVRDRLVEYFLWGMAFHFEPHYSYVRSAVAIIMQLQTIMDDIYDNYATLEEAKLFTEALERWEVDDVDQLPDCIKIGYQFIMSVYEDYKRDAADKDKSFLVPYFKETVIEFGRAYYRESEWLMERRIPSYEETMAHSVVTSGVFVIFAALFPGIKSVAKETIDWMSSGPKLLRSAATMGTLLNDSVSHDRESRGGEMITMMDCRMKYNSATSLVKQVDDGWKDLNTEWVLAATCGVPKDVLELNLNYTRAAHVTYKSGDGFTNPEKILAPHIIALLGDPIVI